MSYIINSTNPFVSIKLTETGREKLAQGQLNFSFWGVGDSEINYDREAIVDANPTDATLSATSRIMRPFDQQPNLKYYITPQGASEPYQTLNSSSVNVVKAIVNNAADERGFFAGTTDAFETLTGNTFTPYYEEIPNTDIDGSTILSVTTTTGFSVGDIVLIKLANDTVGTLALTANTAPVPYLWFKVQSKTVNTITLDRNMPNYSSFGGSNSSLIIYRGGEVYDTIGSGTTTAYWDSGTLAFDAGSNVTAHDVPVWNMNNVWGENVAGITGLTTTNLYEDYTKFGSYPYLGTKNPYLGYLSDELLATTTSDCDVAGVSYLDTFPKSISIIHYTNNTISSLYGEYLYIDALNGKQVEVHLPDLMYHRRDFVTGSGTTMGMKFIASGGTKFIGSTDIEYIDLIEDASLISAAATPMVVGRVYPQLKTVVFHNDEIVSAISYKTNRNWTLPELSASLLASSGGTSTGVLAPGETMYLTYTLNSTSGLSRSISNQQYIKINNTTSGAKDVSFKIAETDLLPYMRKIEAGGYDGLGFSAHEFKLVYQIVSDSDIRPASGSWKEYDFTSTAITGGVGETINPVLLENQNPVVNGFILDLLMDTAAGTFDITLPLGMAPNTNPDLLQLGDERFFYGNLSTYIGATIYKTIFDIRLNSGQFNTTSNPTRSTNVSTSLPDIKVSEVGIYDADKNLVCIGKLSIPVALKVGNTIMLELSMDF